jgi:hypothetical protein
MLYRLVSSHPETQKEFANAILDRQSQVISVVSIILFNFLSKFFCFKIIFFIFLKLWRVKKKRVETAGYYVSLRLEVLPFRGMEESAYKEI